MQFNTMEFVFVFLPVTLAIYYIAGRIGSTWAKACLVVASLTFYAWWNPAYLALILGSMVFNFTMANRLSDESKSEKQKKITLIFGIAANLSAIGYFKYYNFFIESAGFFVGRDFVLETIILPLAISFFTFQQITYLVDARNRKITSHVFLDYCLFVTFFPQLISGPIVHHSEMMPQFKNESAFRFQKENLLYGIVFFSMGMLKKAVLADGAAVYAHSLFTGLSQNVVFSFWETWMGVAAYGFQIYFDFSGYSDMAIGLACLFGISLPLNFNSPYKASSIIDFGRRWHMTLSRFLRDYLYVPLGGNRKGTNRRYLNLMTTMLLGGLWHGAAWTFAAWGTLHGLYLCINHLWRKIKSNKTWLPLPSFLKLGMGRTLTLLAVFFAWTLFRAETWSSAETACSTMLGFQGIDLPRSFASFPFLSNWVDSGWIRFGGMFVSDQFNLFSMPWLLVLLCLAWFAPNTQTLLNYKPTTDGAQSTLHLSSSGWKLFASGFLFFLAIKPLFEKTTSEFLYFNF